MVVEFKFPDVGEGIIEGEVVEWLVGEGDEVEVDQPLVEVETDKAVVEIPSPCKGVILEILVKPEEIIQVGSIMVRILEEGEKAPDQAAAPPIIEEPPQPAAVEEAAAEGLTDTAPTESDESAPAGVVGRLEEAREEIPAVTEPSSESKRHAAKLPLATPAVRRLAREQNIDLTLIHGTGEGGRILRDDLLKFAGEKDISISRHHTVPPAHVEEERHGETEHIPLRGIRRAIARQMTKSIYTIPHVTSMDQADATELVALRERLQPEAESQGVHLTYLSFFIKAVTACLQEHPYVNSSLHEEDQEIILKKYYHIGFATDTEEGLMVPVVKNADRKNLIEIAAEAKDLIEKARTRSINLADLKGGTFTITDFGSLGGGTGTPIINHPEVAILGVGVIKDTPVVMEGQIVVRKIVPLSFSFDHRVIDGAEAQRFLNDLIAILEKPDQLDDL